MKRINILLNALVMVAIWTFAPSAFAMTDPQDINPTLISGGAATNSSYDSSTDTYSSTTIASSLHDDSIASLITGTAYATDIKGVAFINAKIDSTGKLLGGTYVWVGSSESLGIATGTALITATLTSVFFDAAGSTFQFRARVDTVSPALAAVTGPIKTMLLYDYISPDPAFFNNPWAVSFASSSYTHSPDIWMSPNALPLSFEEVLASFSSGATLDTPLSAYNHISDIYTMDGVVGSNAFPASLRTIPGFSVVANDVLTDIHLDAKINSSGTVLSGDMQWKGVVPSIGITEYGSLLEGRVDEVFYVTNNGPRFEFLVTIDTLHPRLEAAVGPVETILIYDFQAPGQDFFNDPWNASFSDAAFTQGPNIYGSPESMMNSDTDGDGVADSTDNCVALSNGNQRDVDNDGIGSNCDADLNNDCIVNFGDISVFAGVFLSNNANADLDGSGVVNFFDFALITQQFLNNYFVDNPSAIPNLCDSAMRATK